MGTPGAYQIDFRSSTPQASTTQRISKAPSGEGPSQKTAKRAWRRERGQKSWEDQVGPGDEAAISQLMSLGNFGRWKVIEALIAVDRDVEQAALHLTGQPVVHLGEFGFVRDRPSRSLEDMVVSQGLGMDADVEAKGRGRGN